MGDDVRSWGMTWDHGGCQIVTIKLCFHKTHMSILLTQFYRIPYNTLISKYELWMGIKVYKSCFQRVAGWCEAIEVVRWHSPVSFGGECSSSHRRWFRYTRNESQLGWYRVMNITPLWATIVVLRGFFYCKSLVKLLIWCIYVGISRNSIEIGGFTKLSQWIDIIQCYVLLE